LQRQNLSARPGVSLLTWDTRQSGSKSGEIVWPIRNKPDPHEVLGRFHTGRNSVPTKYP